MKKKLFVLLIAMSLVMLFGCSKKEEKANSADSAKTNNASAEVKDDKASEGQKVKAIKEKGTLVLGTCADYPPMEWIMYKDGKEEFVGMDIEIAKKVAEELGVELEIKNMGFEGLLGSLKAGDVDIVLAGMVASDERKQVVDFSEPYYSGGQVLLVRVGDEGNFKSFDDLKGKKIGAQLGTIQLQYAEKEYGDNVVGFDNNNNLIKELENKTLDCLFLAELPAKQFAAVNKNVKVVEHIGVPNEDGNAIGIQKGNDDLKAVCDKVIKKLNDEGQIQKWLDEYIELSSKQVEENK